MIPDPQRPQVGDTYTHEGGWVTEVLAVDRHNVTIRVSLDTTSYETRVTPGYFADTRANWTPKERA